VHAPSSNSSSGRACFKEHSTHDYSTSYADCTAHKREAKLNSTSNSPGGDVHDIVREGRHGVLLQYRDLATVGFMRMQEELLLHKLPHLLRIDRLVLRAWKRACDSCENACAR
jgi:hypothetical protein